MEHQVAVYRKEHFNAAHKMYCADWTDEENKRVFGACSNPNYHGHNYDLIVKVVGVPDPITGFVINTKDLSKIVGEEVIARFDHKNLKPSAENIAIVIYNLLRPRIAEQLALKIRLYETERNFVDYPA